MEDNLQIINEEQRFYKWKTFTMFETFYFLKPNRRKGPVSEPQLGFTLGKRNVLSESTI